MAEPDPRNRVVLKVDGMEYAGWLEVRIARGVDRAAADFTLSVTRQYWPIRPGSACEVWIGPDRLITGWVDEVNLSHASNDLKIEVKGRSRTADLIDCSAVNRPGQWSNQSLQRIADDLARPYGVQVIARTADKVIPDHQLQQGETVIESLNRLCAMRGLVATDDADGRLILHRPGSGPRAAQVLAGKGGNVLKATAKFSQRDRFHRYIVKGQQAGFSLDDSSQIAQPAGSATDPGIRATRTLIVIAEAQADAARCADRAQWEAANRAGRGVEITATVAGWRQQNGALWPVNGIVPFKDEIMGFSADLLIAEATYSKGSGGTLTELRLAPPEAYVPQPAVPANPALAGYAGLLRREIARNG